MLYDKRWERHETKPAVLSFAGLIAWLEKRDPAEAYDYDDCKGKCLYGLYTAAHGIAWEVSGACSSIDSGKERANFCAEVYEHVACRLPWTFGAALDRAREALVTSAHQLLGE